MGCDKYLETFIHKNIEHSVYTSKSNTCLNKYNRHTRYTGYGIDISSGVKIVKKFIYSLVILFDTRYLKPQLRYLLETWLLVLNRLDIYNSKIYSSIL